MDEENATGQRIRVQLGGWLCPGQHPLILLSFWLVSNTTTVSWDMAGHRQFPFCLFHTHQGVHRAFRWVL